MKKLSKYIEEEVSTSLGDAIADSTFATPGNTIGMGDPKLPTCKDPGTDIFGTTKTAKPKRKKKEKDK